MTRPVLNERQLQVLRHHAAGGTSKAFARQHGIDLTAARQRLRRVCDILGARSVPHAVDIAWRLRLFGGAE